MSPTSQGEKKVRVFFDNTSTSEKGRGGRAHSYTFYLDAIRELGMGREFKLLEAFCTDGDIRPPYPYQWRAISTQIVGDDDPFEGIGESPLEALRNLYAQMKDFKQNPPELDDEELNNPTMNTLHPALEPLEIHFAEGQLVSDDYVAYAEGYNEALEAATPIIEKLEKAYGGCHNCYGKGYATVKQFITGHGEADIGDEDVVIHEEVDPIRPCTRCERGKQFATVIEKLQEEARKEGREEAVNYIRPRWHAIDGGKMSGDIDDHCDAARHPTK